MRSVDVGLVPVVDCASDSKEQAVKVLEESAEVFGAWQTVHFWLTVAGEEYPGLDREGTVEVYTGNLLDEIADLITAACGLASAMGCHDMTDKIMECADRNRNRGRIS